MCIPSYSLASTLLPLSQGGQSGLPSKICQGSLGLWEAQEECGWDPPGVANGCCTVGVAGESVGDLPRIASGWGGCQAAAGDKTHDVVPGQ